MTEPSNNQFSETERAAVYRAIYERRDVRSQFLKKEIPEECLQRILNAAHHAPSVGFMQPWDFIIIRSEKTRQKILENFATENEKASQHYEGKRKNLFNSLKLQGILESPINLCITCDRSRGGPHVLGRNSIIEMDLFSSCLAVQNLWLAARAEGIGVGWVSILDQEVLSSILGLPTNVYPVAYLCMGYVSEFFDQPELELKNWRKRIELEELIHHEKWDGKQRMDNES